MKSAIVAFITGQKDIDAEWDAYLADLEKLGLSDTSQPIRKRMMKVTNKVV